MNCFVAATEVYERTPKSFGISGKYYALSLIRIASIKPDYIK